MALQRAMQTKGQLDRNMQTVLGLLNIPSRADVRKLQTKLDALQGSLVNLNLKIDRLIEARARRSRPRPKPAPVEDGSS
ncbi:MAG TPA: hypothetical protein VFD84_13885 [Candidatus Binatia bacterium]|nr:hypothetical protein [Candidatus Binatia bacterium]